MEGDGILDRQASLVEFCQLLIEHVSFLVGDPHILKHFVDLAQKGKVRAVLNDSSAHYQEDFLEVFELENFLSFSIPLGEDHVPQVCVRVEQRVGILLRNG